MSSIFSMRSPPRTTATYTLFPYTTLFLTRLLASGRGAGRSRDFLLEVDDLKLHFPTGRASLRVPRRVVHALQGVSFRVPRKSTFSIVGESGSGKSTTE